MNGSEFPPASVSDTNTLSRRGWLKAAGLSIGAWAAASLGGGGILSPRRAAGADVIGSGRRRRALRVAHLTDVHVQPERGANEGFAACLRHVQSQKDAPAFILNTGDSIMDAFRKGRDRTELQWDLWGKILKQECSLPVESLLGNHDIWGWDRKKSKTTGQEPSWGKKRGLEGLGLDRAYRSFDRGGWHFVMLDSVVPFDERHYRAKLDDEQFDWLQRDLAAVDPATPVLVSSHIPIFSPAGVLNTAQEKPEAAGHVVASGGAMHLDAKRICELFREHPNVKLCISGHLHLIDRADYYGVTYLSNPAVSGGWWKGKHQDRFCEMYTLLDLYDDGTFDAQYVEYGWVAWPEPPKPTTAPPEAE